MTTLHLLPPEILEHIAYFLGTDELLGPPSYLIPLLLANRKIYSVLSTKSNPYLYASIFTFKFDSHLPKKRLGEHTMTPHILCKELQHRMALLKQIQALSGSTDAEVSWDLAEGEDPDTNADEVLLYCYLMMIENQGKNHAQLRRYAQISNWLRYYWFHERGRSGAVRHVRKNGWPSNSPQTALAMWLFWFFLKPDEYPKNSDAIEAPLNILKVQAFGAHKYPLSDISWVEFNSKRTTTNRIMWYGRAVPFIPPPLAIPAILSYLSLTNRRRSIPLTPSDPIIPDVPPRDDWGSDWARAVGSDRVFTHGSFDGVWEGFFTYLDFSVYARTLGGAPPHELGKGQTGQHQQTWKLREHRLPMSQRPLRAGDPLRSYIPNGTRLSEHRGGVTIEEPGQTPLEYVKTGANEDSDDVLITGEGHSAWGQFSLVGRVRPCDGFISLSKDYADGGRGKWLYRGYLVGNAYGNFVGRWRDTMTDSALTGYEGCFSMSRRR